MEQAHLTKNSAPRIKLHRSATAKIQFRLHRRHHSPPVRARLPKLPMTVQTETEMEAWSGLTRTVTQPKTETFRCRHQCTMKIQFQVNNRNLHLQRKVAPHVIQVNLMVLLADGFTQKNLRRHGDIYSIYYY